MNASQRLRHDTPLNPVITVMATNGFEGRLVVSSNSQTRSYHRRRWAWLKSPKGFLSCPSTTFP